MQKSACAATRAAGAGLVRLQPVGRHLLICSRRANAGGTSAVACTGAKVALVKLRARKSRSASTTFMTFEYKDTGTIVAARNHHDQVARLGDVAISYYLREGRDSIATMAAVRSSCA